MTFSLSLRARAVARRRLLVAALALPAVAGAQDHGPHYDQRDVGAVLDRQGQGGPVPGAVAYAPYVLAHASGNTVLARHELYRWAGEGDLARGRERLALAALFNGGGVTDLALGDTLVLPARPADFDLDPLAFAPFPQAYPGAAGYDKLVVIDKTGQAWAAYARGRLVRWGPSSTGAAATPTPSGRFTMNWRAEERVSSESPPGEAWRMRWVMNIQARRGIHLHQYDAVPKGPPVGHGCVRLVEADARWLYGWSDPWTTTAGPGALGGRVLAAGTTVLVLGDEPAGEPPRFVAGADGPRRYVAALPADPASVPPGER